MPDVQTLPGDDEARGVVGPPGALVREQRQPAGEPVLDVQAAAVVDEHAADVGGAAPVQVAEAVRGVGGGGPGRGGRVRGRERLPPGGDRSRVVRPGAPAPGGGDEPAVVLEPRPRQQQPRPRPDLDPAVAQGRERAPVEVDPHAVQRRAAEPLPHDDVDDPAPRRPGLHLDDVPVEGEPRALLERARGRRVAPGPQRTRDALEVVGRRGRPVEADEHGGRDEEGDQADAQHRPPPPGGRVLLPGGSRGSRRGRHRPLLAQV